MRNLPEHIVVLKPLPVLRRRGDEKLSHVPRTLEDVWQVGSIFRADAHAAIGVTADEKAHRIRAFRRFLRLAAQRKKPAEASSPDRQSVIFRAAAET